MTVIPSLKHVMVYAVTLEMIVVQRIKLHILN